jgi:hypothetical protein
MRLVRRLLRNSTHRARIEHYCDNCDNLIFPNDLYNVTVEIRGQGKTAWLFVRKEHEHPACPYPDGDEGPAYCTTTETVHLRLAA